MLYGVEVEIFWYYWIVFEVVIEELEIFFDVEFCFDIVFVMFVIVIIDCCDVVYY